VVIATDDEQDGTNALFVRPPGIFSYAYGENSFMIHQQLGRLAGANVHIFESEQLMLDLDTPKDLMKYQEYVVSGKFDALPLLDDIPSQIESEEILD
jgi:2-phospho-L-lactate guanylyltransferase (CobY/MobA/RfbA family)